MRIVISILLLGVVFGSITLLGRQGGVSNGSRTFISYGWPQPWLRADVVGIDVTGKDYDRVRTERIVDWRVLPISAGIAAGIAALLSLPLFLFLQATSRKYYARVLLAVVACMVVVWAVYPLFSRQYVWGPSASAWQVWVRMRHPFFIASPKWFSSGTLWSLAEATARLLVIVAGAVLVYFISRFKRDEKRAA